MLAPLAADRQSVRRIKSMAVDNPEVIGIVSTTVAGEVVLTIADHLPSDEANEHLPILQ